MTGIPAIVAYPIVSGIPRAARVTPAATSNGIRFRSIGKTPCRIGRRRFFAFVVAVVIAGSWPKPRLVRIVR